MPAPCHVVGRQAVGVVVEVLHGGLKQRHAECRSARARQGAHDDRQRQVVGHELVRPPAAREKRAFDRALLLDRGAREHHEDEGHDDDDDAHHDLPHRGVALDVVGGIAYALVRIGVDEVAHAGALVGERLHDVCLGVRALGYGQVAVVEEDGVGVGGLNVLRQGVKAGV